MEPKNLILIDKPSTQNITVLYLFFSLQALYNFNLTHRLFFDPFISLSDMRFKVDPLKHWTRFGNIGIYLIRGVLIPYLYVNSALMD